MRRSATHRVLRVRPFPQAADPYASVTVLVLVFIPK